MLLWLTDVAVDGSAEADAVLAGTVDRVGDSMTKDRVRDCVTRDRVGDSVTRDKDSVSGEELVQ